jgi:tetratricopeptide (TPR) repeat protein
LPAALLLGAILVSEGWRAAAAYSLEVAAKGYEGQPEVERQQARIGLLEQAARAAPGQALLRLRLGQAYMDLYQTEAARLDERDLAFDAARLVVALCPLPGFPAAQPALAGLVPRRLVDSAEPVRGRTARGDVARRYLVPALRNYLVSRDLCPMIAKAQLQIAANDGWFARADPRGAYLARARRSFPSSAEMWYLVGALELQGGNNDQAWSDWRRSLAISTEYLDPILARARPRLSDAGMIDKLLPERAETVMAAAARLYPGPDADEAGPFLRKALDALEAPGADPSAENLALKGRIEAALGRDAAVASYEAALRLAPRQVPWRFEYARLLYKKRRLQDARRALQLVLDLQPGHEEAQRLLRDVTREIAEGK